MKVLLQNRINYSTTVAGDTIQLQKTKEYLVKIGIQAQICSRAEIDLSEYDLVHLFNLIPIEETYRQFKNARRQRKKIVLSTVFWDPAEFLSFAQPNRQFQEWWEQTMGLRQEVLEGVDLILPNSVLELKLLQQYFPKLPPAEIIPNAADRFFITATPDRFVSKYQLRDFLLSVGRISRRKNQLSLIKTAAELRLPLVLIGPLNDGLYYQECRRAAAGIKVRFIDTLNQTELASAYAAARVHALVSWYDTPGLVSLEAALAGCRIVSTDRGSAVEYFNDLVHYCNPAEPQSITTSISKAWNSQVNPQLRERVLQKYTWEETAVLTAQAYRKV